MFARVFLFESSGGEVAEARQDRISIVGMKLQPRIGVTPGERRLPQSIVAHVSVWGDFEAAGRVDQLSRTVNYSDVFRLVREVSGIREFNLLEALAYEVGRAILERFGVQRVSVRLEKRPASVADEIHHVEVEVTLP
jgi:7,8-dihydroneopterin aldolase/epimerase/oxygenase